MYGIVGTIGQAISSWVIKSAYGKKYKDQTEVSQMLNELTFYDALDWLLNITLCIFEWELPDSCEPFELEKVLLEQGQILFFRGTVAGDAGEFLFDTPGSSIMHAPFVADGYNMYNESIRRTVNLLNGNQYHFRIDNSVICYNNIQRTPGIDRARVYATRIADTTRTLDTAARKLKDPYIIATNRQGEAAAKEMFTRKYMNDEYILMYDSTKLQEMEISQTPSNVNVIQNLWAHKFNLINEYLTKVGLDNSNTEKRERQLVDEVNANNDVIGFSLYSGLVMRQKCVDAINKLWPGTNASVRRRTLDEMIELLRGMEGDPSVPDDPPTQNDG